MLVNVRQFYIIRRSIQKINENFANTAQNYNAIYNADC